MFYEKLKKSIKRKSKMLLNMLIPGHIPEFSVVNIKKPIFFVYFINGDIFYISNRANVEFSEVIIDEVIKVGIENDEFVFYPAREDSAFFRQNFEIYTFRFIKLILQNNLNVVASDICSAISAFEAKILDYAILYRQRLENAICNIDFIDRDGILGVSANLKWEAENALKARIIEIAKENVVDSKENIFEILFGSGIYEVENIGENAITQDKILSYYNRSNLTNCIENEIALLVKGSLQNEMRFFISYFIDSIFLRANENGKIFADSNITIKSISMQGSPKFCYSNNDLKIEFDGENICIYNLQKISFILHSLKSKWILGNDESAFEMSENLIIADKKLIKNDIFLKNLHLNLKISHKLELIYSTNSDEKRFVGSGSVKIVDMF